MSREVLTVALYPKPNTHIEDRPVVDVWDIVKLGILAGLLWVIAVLVFV